MLSEYGKEEIKLRNGSHLREKPGEYKTANSIIEQNIPDQPWSLTWHHVFPYTSQYNATLVRRCILHEYRNKNNPT